MKVLKAATALLLVAGATSLLRAAARAPAGAQPRGAGRDHGAADCRRRRRTARRRTMRSPPPAPRRAAPTPAMRSPITSSRSAARAATWRCRPRRSMRSSTAASPRPTNCRPCCQTSFRALIRAATWPASIGCSRASSRSRRTMSKALADYAQFKSRVRGPVTAAADRALAVSPVRSRARRQRSDGPAVAGEPASPRARRRLDATQRINGARAAGAAGRAAGDPVRPEARRRLSEPGQLARRLARLSRARAGRSGACARHPPADARRGRDRRRARLSRIRQSARHRRPARRGQGGARRRRDSRRARPRQAGHRRGDRRRHAARRRRSRRPCPALRTRAAAGTGAQARAAADAFFAFGQYADAATLYQAALQKGGEDPNLVNSRLGAALALAGRRPEAEAALHAVTGPRADLAGFWLVWLAHRPA